MSKPNFENKFSSLQKSLINRLAEIEQEDADACAHCGGEDCVCCEIYQDRQKWAEPEEILYNDDPLYENWHSEYEYESDEDEEDEESEE